MISLDHLNANDLLLVDRVVEEAQIATLHGFHIIRGLIVADPVPAFTFSTLFHLIFPGPGIRLGFEQPQAIAGISFNQMLRADFSAMRFRHRCARCFPAGPPGQKLLYYRAEINAMVQDRIDAFGDRHLDGKGARPVDQRSGSMDTFND